MSLFHKLSDIYFDAVNLGEAIESIPAQCDCQNAEAHISGQCCCAEAAQQRPSGKVSCAGCLEHLDKLKDDIRWLQEDMTNERKQLRPEEVSSAIEGRLMLIESVSRNLFSEAVRIEEDLTEFRANCAQSALQRIKQSKDRFKRYTSELNQLL